MLLGSGVSRSAGIFTGWDVVFDLVKKLALLENEDPGLEPDKWYESFFNSTPGYSTILEKLTNTSEERINLLRLYVEPTEEEFIDGIKRPTKARQAIASLVKKATLKLLLLPISIGYLNKP